eukprot:scaffold1536_cov397-Prasinococcus_capsulatus_cf.AAC.29
MSCGTPKRHKGQRKEHGSPQVQQPAWCLQGDHEPASISPHTPGNSDRSLTLPYRGRDCTQGVNALGYHDLKISGARSIVHFQECESTLALLSSGLYPATYAQLLASQRPTASLTCEDILRSTICNLRPGTPLAGDSSLDKALRTLITALLIEELYGAAMAFGGTGTELFTSSHLKAALVDIQGWALQVFSHRMTPG